MTARPLLCGRHAFWEWYRRQKTRERCSGKSAAFQSGLRCAGRTSTRDFKSPFSLFQRGPLRYRRLNTPWLAASSRILGFDDHGFVVAGHRQLIDCSIGHVVSHGHTKDNRMDFLLTTTIPIAFTTKLAAMSYHCEELRHGWVMRDAEDNEPSAWMTVAQVPSQVHVELLAHRK